MKKLNKTMVQYIDDIQNSSIDHVNYALNKILSYKDFISQPPTIEMFIGENKIFEGFLADEEETCIFLVSADLDLQYNKLTKIFYNYSDMPINTLEDLIPYNLKLNKEI